MKLIQTGRAMLASGALAVAALGAAGSAEARDVVWSVGVGAPGAQVIVGNAPVYMAPPIVVHAPTYYAPPPVYYQPRPIYYQPRPIYYQPQPVYRVQGPRWVERGPRHGGGRHHDRHRHGGRDRDRD